MTLYKWSRTPDANGNADSTCAFPEGMAASALNDGTRGMMAAVAKYRDDIAGAIVTAGTSTAYTISSFEGYDTLAHLSGLLIAFTPHTTNGATVTLNVDSLGAKPLRTSTGVELLANTLIAGTPYMATYNSTDAAWYLHGFYANPYNVPLGAGMDFWGATAPNSAFAFPTGQEISRTTYATLFALIGTTYGAGNTTTTFNLPDKSGRVSAGADNMSGSLSNRLNSTGGMNGTSIGAIGGGQVVNLAANQIPSLTSTGTASVSVISSQTGVPSGANTGSALTNGGGPYFGAGNSSVPMGFGQITSAGGGSANVTYTNGSLAAVRNLPPIITCNYILRVI